MNRLGLAGAYLIAFILKPVMDGILPGHAGNGNLILCLTTVLIFLFDDYVPIITIGTVFAILDDLVYGIYCGPEAISTLVVCLAIIAIKYFFNNENYLNALTVIAVSTWLEYTVEWGIYCATGATYTYGYVIKIILLNVIVNTIVGMIVYAVMYSRIRKKKYEKLYR